MLPFKKKNRVEFFNSTPFRIKGQNEYFSTVFLIISNQLDTARKAYHIQNRPKNKNKSNITKLNYDAFITLGVGGTLLHVAKLHNDRYWITHVFLSIFPWIDPNYKKNSESIEKIIQSYDEFCKEIVRCESKWKRYNLNEVRNSIQPVLKPRYPSFKDDATKLYHWISNFATTLLKKIWPSQTITTPGYDSHKTNA